MSTPTNHDPRFGGTGLKLINDTSEHVIDAYHLFFLEDTMIEQIMFDPDFDTDDDLSTVVFPKGSYLAGPMTSVELTSGSCIAYLL